MAFRPVQPRRTAGRIASAVLAADRDDPSYERGMKLYMLAGCAFGHRAAFALHEKQLSFELELFERGKRPPELEAVGPAAKSPTLFDDEARVYDSLVVLEYLEERYAQPPLLPATPSERAAVRSLQARVSEDLIPKYGAVISEAVFKTPRDDAKVAEALRAFSLALAPWERQLDGKNFLAGERFTLADITLFTVFPSLKQFTGFEIPAELPHLATWHRRISTHPGAAVPQKA